MTAGGGAAPTARDYAFLDLLRFGSALLVLFGHVRGLFFVSIRDVEQPGILLNAFYLATSLHHEAVVIFFVISGFLVGGAAAERLMAGSFHPVSYAIDRFSRIYAVMPAALLVMVAVVVAGQHFFPETRMIAQRPLAPIGVANGWALEQVPCHLLSVQYFACRVWLQNPPLWSLGFEWVLYFLGPLVLLALAGRSPAWRLAGPILAVAVVVTVAIDPLLFAKWAAFWLLGAGAALASRRVRVLVLLACAALLAAAGAMVFSRLALVGNLWTDTAIALAMAVALASPAVLRFAVLPRLAGWGAAFSFSLYVLHLPLAILIGAMLETAGWPPTFAQPGQASFSAFAITVAACIGASWAFATQTEARTHAFRAWLRRRMAPASKPAP